MLVLRRLKIKDFKNIPYLEIDFENYNLISGNNGSGKSSILQAIRLLLTNTLPEKLAEYIRWGQEGFELQLIFEFQGIEYSYKYEYDTSSKKELKFNDVVLKGTDASSKLEEFVNAELLLYSSISEQGQSYSILNESPAKRLERFKTILGVERLSRIIEVAKEKVKLKKSEADLLDKEVKTLQGVKYSYFEQITLPDIQAIQAELEKQEKEKAEKEEFDKIKQEWSIRKSEYDKTITRQEELNSLIQFKKSEVFGLQKVDFNIETYNNLLTQKQTEELEEQKYKTERLQYSNYKKSLSELQSELDRLNDNKLKHRLFRLSPLSFSKEDLIKLNELINNLKVDLKQIDNHILLAKEGKCSTCGQDFKHSPDELEAKSFTIQEQIKNLESESQDKRQQLIDYDKKVESNKQTTEKVKEIDSDIERIILKLKQLTIVNEPVEKTFNVSHIDEQIKSLKEVKNLFDSCQTKEKELLDAITKYEIELKTLSTTDPGESPVQPRRFGFDSIKYEELKKEINIYDQKVAEKKRIEEHNDKIEKEEKENKLKIKDIETQYYACLGESKEYEEARNILEKNFSSFLIEKGTQYVESKMNSFFQKCYPKYSVLFKQTENKKSIDFYYTDNETETIASASLCSGFEKQLLSIAFRVALASITSMGFLILDEVDSDASSENSISLYSNLIDSDIFSQLLVVSHKAETKEMLVNEYYAKEINLMNGEMTEHTN